jgi:phosphatidylglycerol:prolipoprotein diacylglycerol transferase
MYQTLCVLDFRWLLAVWAVAALAASAWSLARRGWNAETRGTLLMLAIAGVLIAFVMPKLVGSAGLPIQAWGTMLFVAMASGVALSMARARRVGLDPELILSLAVWAMICGILGARIFYVIEYWPKFQKSSWGETLFAVINLTQGGMVVYGSMLAGGLALLAFIYRYRLPPLAMTDLVAPGVVLGVALGRVGCFLNGCCYGGLSDVPWSVRFPQGSPPFVDQVQHGQLAIHGLSFRGAPHELPVISAVEPGSPAERKGLKAGQRVLAINDKKVADLESAQWELLSLYGAGTPIAVRVDGEARDARWTISGAAQRSLPVHPTQLYSLIDGLLLFYFLLAYEPYKRREGELTAWVLVIHPISRFLLEVIRVDESAVFNTNMSISQNISLAIFAGGLCLWIYLLARPPRPARWPAIEELAPRRPAAQSRAARAASR